MINEKSFKVKKDGSVYCDCFCRTPELIENYDKAVADTTQVWDCHHRNEEYYSQKELKALGLYYDCPPCELIFMTRAEHRKMDSFCKRMSKANKGKTRSEGTRQKISETQKQKKQKCREAYKKSGRKDWNTFQKEYYKEIK